LQFGADTQSTNGSSTPYTAAYIGSILRLSVSARRTAMSEDLKAKGYLG